MTAADLARIAEAIDADERTEAANWPLSRERSRAYLALARAALELLGEESPYNPWWIYYYDGDARCRWCDEWQWFDPPHATRCPVPPMNAALAALAPAADAGEAGT